MSESEERFVECSFCEYQCKYRSIAEKNMKADEDYTKRFFELFREGDLDAVAEHVGKESVKIMETDNLDSLLAMGLCLYVIGTNILEIPDVLRRRLGRLAKSKIRNAIKDELGVAAPPAPVVAAPAKPAVKVPQAVVAKETVKPLEFPSTAPEVVEALPPAAIIENWLRSDKEFLYYVDEIIQQKDDLVAVKYDLETEGFLTGVLIKILYAGRYADGKKIMKIGIKSRVDVPYHLNIIMGKTHEGFIAASIPGDLKDESVLYKKLESTSMKDITGMDRLTLMLNRDKFLIKNISKTLILKSQDESISRSIQIPITIQKRGEEGCDLVLKTFLDENKIKPSELFINIMDGIAENMDYLLELPQEERGEIPMAKEDWFTIKVKPQMGAFSSKFIKRVALPDIPTCPHCDRPLPQASSTDYRRCPNCYEKL
ncbi:MAG: hypothetical protein ACTSR8_19030 [Promethearchaeota archaeon]